MTNVKELPVTSSPNQSFTSTLNVNGENITLGFFLTFSEIAGYWLLDITRAGSFLLSGIPLVPGTGAAVNLLRQHEYLRIGELYVVNASNVAESWPGSSSLGTDWVLLWGDNE